MVGGSKNKIAIFLCMGPIFGQKNTKRPPPQKKEKEKKKERRQVQYFCRKLAIC